MTYRITYRDGEHRVETFATGGWHALPIDGRALAASLEIQLQPDEVRELSDREALGAIQDQLELERYEFERDRSQRAAICALLREHASKLRQRMRRCTAKAS